MPVPIELLRVVLVLLAVFFGFMLGRAAVRAWRDGRRRGLYGWTVRTLLTVGAAAWGRGVDRLVTALLVLLAVAVAGGAWAESRPRKPPEDLTREIFPE
jgi:hypothetical protein